MTRVRSLSTLLALASVAALPACSMFGSSHNNQSSRASYPSQTYAATPNYNSGAQTASSEQSELTPDTVRGVQQTLRQDGMYHSNVDGVWGPATQAAVRDYQQRNNMNVTGQLDQATLASLNPSNAQSNEQPQPNSQQYGNNAPNYNPPPNNNPQPANANQPNTANTH